MTAIVYYDQLRAFATNFSGMSMALRNWLYNFMNEEAERFLADIRRRTPVRTGRLRAAWKLKSLKWDGTTIEAVFVNEANDGYASYADFVEEGHAKPYKSGAKEGDADWVQGKFMLKYTEKELRQSLPSRLRKEFKAYVKSYKVG